MDFESHKLYGEDFVWLNIQYSGGLLWRGNEPFGS